MTSQFEAATSHLRNHGGYVHECLQVGVDDQGVRGIFANGTVSKDTLLLRVPPGLILDSGQRPNTARSRLSPESAVSESVSHLLREEAKGDESLFRDWIRLLPSLEEFRSFHPYFCSSEERVALTAMCPRIFDHLSRFDRLVEGSRGSFPASTTVEKVQWAFANCLTRAHGGMGLIPFTDMFNHSSTKGSIIGANHEIWAGIDLQPGDQVFVSYGNHWDTLDLWFQYGFFDPAAGHCIGCDGLKMNTGVAGLQAGVAEKLQRAGHRTVVEGDRVIGVRFDHRATIGEAGPSKSLMDACTLLGAANNHELTVEPNPLKSFRKLYQILSIFEQEIDVAAAGAASNNPRVQTCRAILRQRLDTLQRNRELIKARCWKLIAG